MPLIFAAFIIPMICLADTELDVIEVKASKDIERFTFATKETITVQEIEGQPLGLISQELEKIPGLIASQNGGPGSRISFFLRGTENRHLAFTLDGLKINDTSNTDRQFDAAYMTSPILYEVVIHKGPQAVLYGADAMGGVIELKTRKGEEAPQKRLNFNLGSFGTIGATLSSDWKDENKNRGTVTVTRFHTDGISRLNQKRYGANEKDSTDITQLTSSSDHQLTNKIQSQILISYLNGKSEQDGFESDNPDDFSRNDQYILQQNTSVSLFDSEFITIRNGFNRHQRLTESSSREEFFNGESFQNEFIYHLERDSTGILAGISNEHEAAKSIKMDKGIDLNSLFLQTYLKIKNFKLHAGGRADHHSIYGNFLTGASGLSFYDFNFQYSQGYKPPSLYQLYGPDSFGSPVGNPNLVPEINHFLEASWRKSRDNYETEISIFQNRLSNLFTYSFGSGYFNQQRFIAEGIELSGKIKQMLIEISGSFTHQQFRKEESPVLRRPYNAAQLGISYFPIDTIEFNTNIRWFSSRRDIQGKLNPFEVFDFGLRKFWIKDEIVLQLRNVFDREYEEVYGFSVLPRSLYTSYTHRF